MTSEKTKPETGEEPLELRFEDALRELEEVTLAVESGELPLEDSLARFERGVRLARHCKESLEAAEGRVQKLLDTGELVPFEAED